MVKYSLRFATGDASGEQELTFYERSVGGALEVAKAKATGRWVELYQDGQPICRMELVDESGVWRIGTIGRGAASEN